MSYAEEVEFAARNLIELTVHEEGKLKELSAALAVEAGKFRMNKWDFETSDMSDDFSDAHVMAAFGRMAKAHSEAEVLKTEVAKLQASIGSRQVAVQAICGALLQIAKQGISLVHGSLANAPEGRLLNGIKLSEIVWQARNQAIHYEEGNFRPAVVALFASLEATFGPEFALANHAGQSRAKQVTVLLGWTDYPSFYADLKSLGL